jgi:nitroimidazol reductase NimA-like FMN-containing flavoprotein (pyridoxamine 5'-phosphate oxidase superfamily)
MRRKDREITAPEVIKKILTESHICRLALMDTDEPYIVPLNFGYEDPFLYFHSAPAGRKIDILKKNNRVCFEIESQVSVTEGPEACDYTTQYRSVIGYGKVELISDPVAIRAGLDVIMRQHGREGKNSYKDQYMGHMLVLRMQIERLSCKQNGIF